jgi:hypothetical protein
MTETVTHATPQDLWAAFEQAKGPTQTYESPPQRLIGFLDLGTETAHVMKVVKHPPCPHCGQALPVEKLAAEGVPDDFFVKLRTPTGRRELFRK